MVGDGVSYGGACARKWLSRFVRGYAPSPWGNQHNSTVACKVTMPTYPASVTDGLSPLQGRKQGGYAPRPRRGLKGAGPQQAVGQAQDAATKQDSHKHQGGHHPDRVLEGLGGPRQLRDEAGDVQQTGGGGTKHKLWARNTIGGSAHLIQVDRRPLSGHLYDTDVGHQPRTGLWELVGKR